MTLVEGDLHWRGANGILMRCITREEACELPVEVHRGECGNHTSSSTLVSKAFRQGFLLAYNLPGCQLASKDLQSVPVLCQGNPHTIAGAANDPALMASRYVGARHSGAIRGYRYFYVTHQQIY
jgi:hypothetical protein